MNYSNWLLVMVDCVPGAEVHKLAQSIAYLGFVNVGLDGVNCMGLGILWLYMH